MGKKYGEDLEWGLCDCEREKKEGFGVVSVQESVGWSLREGKTENAVFAT
ncbi:hypothetical protein [Rossellomorea sp. DA94]|nr:hypothetical protein [Rossellomorea sp. DA94]WGG46183.1 hypothetical protein P8596_02880 [Rossellomorea sp. DA94]